MRLLVQGVGRRFRRDFDRPWGADEARASRLVVIGEKGVDRARGRSGARGPDASMHIARIEVRSLDETAEAVDLGQTPADVVFLSFSDSDLNALAAPTTRRAEPKPTPAARQSRGAATSLFGRSLSREGLRQGEAVVVRLLGGADYWRYGVDELAALARRRGVQARAAAGRPSRRCAARRRPRRLPPEAARADLALFRRGRPATTWRPASPSSRLSSALGRRRRRRRAPVAAVRPLRARVLSTPARRAARADRLLPLDLSRRRSRADRSAGRGARARAASRRPASM